MQLFSTILSINESLTKDEFIKLAIKWNKGSREENIIPGLEWNGERNSMNLVELELYLFLYEDSIPEKDA